MKKVRGKRKMEKENKTQYDSMPKSGHEKRERKSRTKK